MSGRTLAAPSSSGSATVDLPVARLNLVRLGFLVMGVGLAIVKWPLLLQVDAQPLFEGVVTCLLTAMSLLAFLGLRYPVRLLPILLFEATWKLIWLSLVALPAVLAGDMDAATGEVAVSCSVVVVIWAVIPWRYAWQIYAKAGGDRWH
ncbi:hypothetical protein JTF08_15795 [Micrococcaceae bacterium RIT802]|nr:hypothetical protein [Micrococcaceae bacterium RIT 802]